MVNGWWAFVEKIGYHTNENLVYILYATICNNKSLQTKNQISISRIYFIFFCHLSDEPEINNN